MFMSCSMGRHLAFTKHQCPPVTNHVKCGRTEKRGPPQPLTREAAPRTRSAAGPCRTSSGRLAGLAWDRVAATVGSGTMARHGQVHVRLQAQGSGMSNTELMGVANGLCEQLHPSQAVHASRGV